MAIHITEGWLLFCIAFAVLLVISLIMAVQTTNFYTQDVVIRKFNIMDLELPASPNEVVNLIKGIYRLPGEQSKKTLRVLRANLYLDFLFMPAAYGSIFIACMMISWKMTSFGHWLFAALAWAQIISWVLDIIENIRLLGKLKPDIEAPTLTEHKAFQRLEITKWGIALLGTVCAISAVMYFWLIGRYSYNSLEYVVTFVAELAIFFVIGKIADKYLSRKTAPGAV